MAGEEYTDGVLGTELAPPTRPRDQGGKFIRETASPARMFEPRQVEGDRETGDTRDAGEDPRLSAIERDIADGREDDAGRRMQRPRQQEPDAEHEFGDDEPEQLASVEPDEDKGTEVAESPAEDDDGEKYEVTVDGKPVEVTLKEALDGYIRQATFHERMTTLNQIQGRMEEDATRLQNGWKAWNKARDEYEQDLKSLIPAEPDWDAMAKINPALVLEQQKIFHTLYKKLADSRNQRAVAEQEQGAETSRRLEKYALEGQNRFYQKHAKRFVNRAQYDKDIQSMRRTVMDAGFSEQEASTVFDDRMLTIALWASIYRRMDASKVRAVDPSKGRTLTPGSATPLNRNASRKGVDEAASRLQKSGSLDDAAAYFRRVL